MFHDISYRLCTSNFDAPSDDLIISDEIKDSLVYTNDDIACGQVVYLYIFGKTFLGRLDFRFERVKIESIYTHRKEVDAANVILDLLANEKTVTVKLEF